jgi:hypothetical protein
MRLSTHAVWALTVLLAPSVSEGKDQKLAETLASLKKERVVRWTPETGQLGGLDLLWPSPSHPTVAPGPIHLTRGHISE